MIIDILFYSMACMSLILLLIALNIKKKENKHEYDDRLPHEEVPEIAEWHINDIIEYKYPKKKKGIWTLTEDEEFYYAGISTEKEIVLTPLYSTYSAEIIPLNLFSFFMKNKLKDQRKSYYYREYNYAIINTSLRIRNLQKKVHDMNAVANEKLKNFNLAEMYMEAQKLK